MARLDNNLIESSPYRTIHALGGCNMGGTPEQKRASRIKCAYGIDQTWIDAQLKYQDYCCDGCLKPFANKDEYRIDHQHRTSIKVVRAILCNSCNLLLGQIETVQRDKKLFDRLLNIIDRYSHYEKIYPEEDA